jgi:hypothetical protein
MIEYIVYGILIGIVLSITWLIPGIHSYINEKFKNMAKKEDLDEITRQIESVKGEIGSQLYRHNLRYEKESQSLIDLSKNLIRIKTLVHHISTLNKNDNSSLSSKRKWLNELFNLIESIEENQLFYTKEIDQEVRVFLYLTCPKIVPNIFSYEICSVSDPEGYPKLSNAINEIILSIRNRLKSFEDFKEN